MRLRTTILLAGLLLTQAANAGTFRFTYASGLGQVTGQLTGTVQPDGNTVTVDRVKDFVTVGGTALPHFAYVTTGSTIYGVPTTPTASFDGSVLDFVACDDVFCAGQGVGFDPYTIAFEPIFTLYAAAFDYQQIQEPLVPGNWSLTAVPEPASWALMLAGFVLAGARLRRRAIALRLP